MNMIPKIIFMLLLLSSLLLNGCGGGSVFAEGGMGGTGISTGTVTAIGSIKVNGVTFDTNDAAIYIEGDRVDNPDFPDGDRDSLLSYGFSEGQVVRVVGEFNADGKTGTADAVYYNDSLEGPVETRTVIDPSTLELIVMGQTVIVDSETILAPVGTSLAEIVVNEMVEISGLRDDTNRIHAGYLELKGTFNLADDVEVKGVVTNLDTLTSKFQIESGLTRLLIDYSTITGTTGLENGVQVEVKGTYDRTQMNASSIELEDDIDGVDDDEFEYEGIVTDTSTFTVNGQFTLGTEIVQTNANTQYKGGLITDIADGVHLEVEGYLLGGNLIAEEVRFRDAIEIDAQVSTLLSASSELVTFNLTGLDGITVEVNSLSKLSGANDLAHLATLLSNGTDDFVEVRGRENSGAATLTVFAEELKVDDDSSKDSIKIQGSVDAVNNPQITILGVVVDTSGIPDSGFEGLNNQPISREQFFAAVSIGNIVGAEGTLSGVSVLWDKIELEDEE